MSSFPGRSCAGQKRAAWDTRSAERKNPPRIPYLEKLSFRTEGERQKKAENDDHF